MIPVVAFSLIFRFYTRLDHLNKRLQQINVSGNIIGRQLEEHKVIMEATNAISSLVSYDYCSIFKINEPTGKLKVIYHYGYDLTEKERMEFLGREFNLGEGLSGKVALEGKYKIIGDYHKQEHILPNEPKGITRLQSILSVPLIRNHKVIGVLTVGHRERDKYSNEDATLIEIIANQTAIAIKNAEKYQRAKRQSEIDELTGLFNYRHFEHELFSWFKEAQEKNEPLSLIIMDIDHFKKINDTYGHLAGNRVLHHLSTLLIKKMQRKGLISRYGGEEFTILLPNTTEKEAFLLAEEIRQEVESQSILIPTDLTKVQEHLEEIPIQVTVSMGLACYPKHADDSLSLIRHADRAMYIGAKRKGRNKVAVYSAV
ncbi:sensor domain-containing diguanylate cyclase [Caldalkalibacillus mannanilyticus]|uniref:sensor domain-containing diguanylate cyclase n=1 Tax=Caldalkalibacillus mannanilyticus TaxID=1418 RepID=UPI0004690B03|nr:sensor domain-containing diguanylate cyclase [Caldalkalibacillus mannanilyticus]